MDILTYGVVVFTLVLLTIQLKRQKVSMGTLVWPYMMLIAMFIIMYPPILRELTKVFGFIDTENLVFFFVCGYLFILTIVHEVRIAKLNDRINELTRNQAILKKENDDNNFDD